jgi:hypothetical protein
MERGQRFVVIPGHPGGWVVGGCLVVAEERDQVGEGLYTAKFGRVDEAHEDVAHVGAVLRLEEVRILPVQNRLFQNSFANVGLS